MRFYRSRLPETISTRMPAHLRMRSNAFISRVFCGEEESILRGIAEMLPPIFVGNVSSFPTVQIQRVGWGGVKSAEKVQ